MAIIPVKWLLCKPPSHLHIIFKRSRRKIENHEKSFDYPNKEYSENILSLIKSLMKNSEKDRKYIIQTAKSLSKQLKRK